MKDARRARWAGMMATASRHRMTLPTPFRNRLRSPPGAAPVRRIPEQTRRRAAALIAQIQDLRPAEAAAAWRARLATSAFWRPVGASVLLHVVALAGLVILHRATLHTPERPPIEVALMPSDPDARVGSHAGISWESAAERTAIMALLEARRSAALMSEIVLTPGRSPRAPSRPSLASRTPPSDSAAPARAAPPEPHPVEARPAEARPAETRPAEPPPPVVAQTAPLTTPEPLPKPVPPHLPVEPVAAPAPFPHPAPTRAPPRQAAAAPAEPPAPPPAAAQAAIPASPVPIDQGEKNYLQAVFERLRPIRDYPELVRYHTSGRMQVAITVSRDGTVLNAQVQHSSGYGFLDRAGLDLVHRASPLPALPVSFVRDSYTFEVPISFRYD
jgi:protein TonB